MTRKIYIANIVSGGMYNCKSFLLDDKKIINSSEKFEINNGISVKYKKYNGIIGKVTNFYT